MAYISIIMHFCRVKELESKITELETETDRLSQALDAQKSTASEAQTKLSKQLDESGRELQKRVRQPIDPLPS